MPKGTEVHVGFFAPQSKHIYIHSEFLHERNQKLEGEHLVGRLRLELVEDFDRLALGGQALQAHCV